MNHLARYALTLLLLACLHSLCLSQTAKPHKEFVAQTQPPELDLAAWKPYTSASGGFTAIFPGTPVEETTAAPPPAQNILMHATTARTEAEYSVGYADYPFEVEGTDRASTFLTNVRDAGVKGTNSRLVEDREEAFAGHPGRYYKVEFGGGYYLTCRSLVVKSRLYMVMATTYGEKKAPPDVVRIYERAADKFINSFRLKADSGSAQQSGDEPPTQESADGEVTRMKKQLEAAGEPVYGICIETAPCSAVKDSIGGSVAKGEVVLPKATNKPQPAYPAIARAARASGTVVVQVIVDEGGKVVAAQPVSGNPLLLAAAVQAARGWEFTPLVLDGKPVKAMGTISFHFVLQ